MFLLFESINYMGLSMPKYTQEMEEKIIARIEQGDRNADISRELGVYRGAVAKRRKEYLKRKHDEEKPEPEQYETIQQEQQESTPLDQQIYTHIGEGDLSDSAMHQLYQIHALLGANSLEEMLETVYSDYVVADKLWLEYKDYPNVSKTFAWVIAIEQGYSADLKHDLDIYMEGYREDRELKEELKNEAERQYDEGYQKGKNDHAILIPCTRCGEPCTIGPGTEIHRLIGEFSREQGIAHDDCGLRYKRIFVP